MRMRNTFWKKTLSMVLSLTMSAGALTALASPMTAEAAGDDVPAAEYVDAQAPSLTKFAGMRDLKNKFKLDGKGIIQPVYYGWRGDRVEEQKWYIAGYDPVARNLVLMCDPEYPIGQQPVPFLDGSREILKVQAENGEMVADNRFQYQSADGVYTGVTPEKIRINHYGASNLRKTLKAMEESPYYFADDERELMLQTKMYTRDEQNKTSYYIEDKLYAPYYAYSNGNGYLVVGRNSSTLLNQGLKISTQQQYEDGRNRNPFYGYNGYDFWTRVQYNNTSKEVWQRQSGSFAAIDVTNSAHASYLYAVPAFALDVNKILFASAVPTEGETSGTTTFLDGSYNFGIPMAFRLDGSADGGIKSSVTVDKKTNSISVGVDSRERDIGLRLCVQGKKDGNDWYYTKEIKRSENNIVVYDTAGADGEVSKPINLADCEVWIEAKRDEDGNLAYAKKAGDVATPTASLKSGIYTEEQSVALASADSNAEIYYTMDGSIPAIESTKYTSPISVKGRPGEAVTTTIRAIAIGEDGAESREAEFIYTIELPHAHSWSQSWESDEKAHWHPCIYQNCDIIQNTGKEGYASHTEDDGTVTAEPTTQSKGTRTYKCTVCGYIMRTEDIPKIPAPAPDNPTQDKPGTDKPGTDEPGTGNSGAENPGTGEAKPAAKNTVLTAAAQKCTVKVTSSSRTNPTVAYIKSTNSKATTVSVPAVITLNGVTYKVTGIGANAFANNKKLTKVTIGKNITSIGKNAFKNCKKLKTVTIHSTVLKSIGAGAFSGDGSLKTITIKSSKLTSKSIGKNALKGTNKKLVIKAPKKKVAAYKKFFKKKGNTKVTVR